LVWNEVRITAHAAAQYVPLKYGEVGTTGTRVTLIAGTHGDEGPWSALAIKMFCQHAVAQLRGRLRVIFTANALAAEDERRNSWFDSPNSVDLDGVFPGNKNGSHTDRPAAAIAPLIGDSEAVIYLHRGASRSDRESHRRWRYSSRARKSRRDLRADIARRRCWHNRPEWNRDGQNPRPAHPCRVTGLHRSLRTNCHDAHASSNLHD